MGTKSKLKTPLFCAQVVLGSGEKGLWSVHSASFQLLPVDCCLPLIHMGSLLPEQIPCGLPTSCSLKALLQHDSVLQGSSFRSRLLQHLGVCSTHFWFLTHLSQLLLYCCTAVCSSICSPRHTSNVIPLANGRSILEGAETGSGLTWGSAHRHRSCIPPHYQTLATQTQYSEERLNVDCHRLLGLCGLQCHWGGLWKRNLSRGIKYRTTTSDSKSLILLTNLN